MSFDLEGYYIIEEGFRQDVKRMEEIRKAEVEKEFRDKNMRLNENLNTAHWQAMKSGDPNASVEAAKLKEEQRRQQIQEEINKRVEADKKILEEKIFGSEGERQRQAELAKEYQDKQAEIASKQARDEFNRKTQEAEINKQKQTEIASNKAQEEEESQLKETQKNQIIQETQKQAEIASNKVISEKKNREEEAAVSKINHEAKEAAIARVLSRQQANAIEWRKANDNSQTI